MGNKISSRSPCENCGYYNTEGLYKWCKPCQINKLKKNFTNWSSGNKKIDKFIQKMQLKIGKPNDTVFEWIPYNQFNNIKEIGFAKVYSAIEIILKMIM